MKKKIASKSFTFKRIIFAYPLTFFSLQIVCLILNKNNSISIQKIFFVIRAIRDLRIKARTVNTVT